MEEKPLTKQDLIDVLNDVVPGIMKEIAKRPTHEEVRQIVREELDMSLPRKTFRLTEVK